MKMNFDDINGYKNLDVDKYSQQYKKYSWDTAIGLQAVDNLKVSNYLKDLSKKNIEGKINKQEVYRAINEYYQIKENREKDNVSEEADKVAVNIDNILSDKSFSKNPAYLSNIHYRLFHNVMKHAGQFRKYNITKEEWVLKGDTVQYEPYDMIKETLIYDFNNGDIFDIKNLKDMESIAKLSSFISNIWQVHPFEEGNTRTTAIFTLKFLQNKGRSIPNQVFAKNSLYFRNALVRANYNNHDLNISEDINPLIKFFENLILDGNHVLSSKELHIDYKWLNKDSKGQEPYSPAKSAKDVSQSHGDNVSWESQER